MKRLILLFLGLFLFFPISSFSLSNIVCDEEILIEDNSIVTMDRSEAIFILHHFEFKVTTVVVDYLSSEKDKKEIIGLLLTKKGQLPGG